MYIIGILKLKKESEVFYENNEGPNIHHSCHYVQQTSEFILKKSNYRQVCYIFC